jgi:hypothetical protein
MALQEEQEEMEEQEEQEEETQEEKMEEIPGRLSLSNIRRLQSKDTILWYKCTHVSFPLRLIILLSLPLPLSLPLSLLLFLLPLMSLLPLPLLLSLLLLMCVCRWGTRGGSTMGYDELILFFKTNWNIRLEEDRSSLASTQLFDLFQANLATHSNSLTHSNPHSNSNSEKEHVQDSFLLDQRDMGKVLFFKIS